MNDAKTIEWKYIGKQINSLKLSPARLLINGNNTTNPVEKSGETLNKRSVISYEIP